MNNSGSRVYTAGIMGDGTPVTHVIINDHHYCIEPGLLFINGRKYNFKWLADGGLVVWMWNMDCDAALELRFIPENGYIVQELKRLLFEKEVFNVKDKERD